MSWNYKLKKIENRDKQNVKFHYAVESEDEIDVTVVWDREYKHIDLSDFIFNPEQDYIDSMVSVDIDFMRQVIREIDDYEFHLPRRLAAGLNIDLG